MHFDEHLLCNVLRAIMISNKAERDVVRLFHMTLDQALERAMVPGFGFKDKLPLTRGFTRNGFVSSCHAQTFCYVRLQVLDSRKGESVDKDSAGYTSEKQYIVTVGR